jgi:hypothetical protein
MCDDARMLEVVLKHPIMINIKTIMNTAIVAPHIFLPVFNKIINVAALRDDDGATILHYAARSSLENVKYVYNMAPKLLRVRNGKDETALMVAARYNAEKRDILNYLGSGLR